MVADSYGGVMNLDNIAVLKLTVPVAELMAPAAFDNQLSDCLPPAGVSRGDTVVAVAAVPRVARAWSALRDGVWRD